MMVRRVAALARLDLTGMDYSDTTPDVSFIPDRLGRPLTITDGGGTLDRVYHDSLPVVATDTYGSGHAWLPGTVLTHTWDAAKARRTAVGRSGFPQDSTRGGSSPAGVRAGVLHSILVSGSRRRLVLRCGRQRGETRTLSLNRRMTNLPPISRRQF